MPNRPLSPLAYFLISLAGVTAALASRPAAALPEWRLVLLDPSAGPRQARLASPSFSLGERGEGPVVIEAPHFDREQAEGPIVASGGAILTQGAARMTAEKLTADPNTGDVVAEGDVVYTEPGRTVRGQQITYNTDTARIRAARVETVVQGVIVRARSIDADRTRYRAASATATTCDLARPHYRLTARSIDMIPNDRIVARHVGVWLLGLKLFTVPRLVARIGEGRSEGGGTPFPRIGSNSRDGFFLAEVFPLVRQPQLYVNLDTRLSIHRGLTGGFEADAPLGRSLQLIGALKYRDEAPNQRTRFVEVDRFPELGILWTSPAPRLRPPAAPQQPASATSTRRRSSTRGPALGAPASPPASELSGGPSPEPAGTPAPPAAGTDGAVLSPATGPPATAESTEPSAPAAPRLRDFRPQPLVGADVEHQPGLLRPPRVGRWYLRAQSTVGYFHQREGSTVGGEAESLTGGRLDFRATAARSGMRLLGVSLPVVQLFFRHSLYDDGSDYSVVGVAARQDWRFGPHWETSLRAFLHQTYGETPFRFDRVEIRTELQPNLTYHTGGTTLSWLARIDVDRRQIFDQEFAVARVLHCLEPRLSYRTRRRQVGLDVRIVGLDFD